MRTGTLSILFTIVFPVSTSLPRIKLALSILCVNEYWKELRHKIKLFKIFYIVIDNMLNSSSKWWLNPKLYHEIFLMIWFYWNSEEQSISQVRFKVTWATSEWLIFLSCQMIRINITNSGELDFNTKGGNNGKRRDKDIRHVENK